MCVCGGGAAWICATLNVTWQPLSLFFVLYFFSPYSPVSLSYVVVSHTKLKLTCKCWCICISVQHFSCMLCFLSAQFIPQTQRRDWEDCDHPHQRKRREDQGPGELLGWTWKRLLALEHAKWAQVKPLMFIFLICGENTIIATICNSYRAFLQYHVEIVALSDISQIIAWMEDEECKRCNTRWSRQIEPEHLLLVVIMHLLAFSVATAAHPSPGSQGQKMHYVTSTGIR